MTENEEELLAMLMQICSYSHVSGLKKELNYEVILPELERQGFEKSTVLSALDWISDLVTDLDQEEGSQNSIRVFSSQECALLDTESRNCLIKLENMGILNRVTRERVIEQAIALRKMGLENSLVKWVTYLVLCSHPEQEVALDRLELFVGDTFLGGMQ